MLAILESPASRTGLSFEELLEAVEGGVGHLGSLHLFQDHQPRLSITLLREAEGGPVTWGLKAHQSWVFKATLLRFAHGEEAVHLLVTSPGAAFNPTQAWLVKRNPRGVWALPLAPEMVSHLPQPWMDASD